MSAARGAPRRRARRVARVASLVAGVSAWIAGGTAADEGVPAGTHLPGASGPDRALVLETRLPAGTADVWRLWTEAGAVTEWFAPEANVELRPGGAYELYFNPEAPEGTRGGEGNVVLAWEPESWLRFTWNAPPHLPSVRDQRTTVTVSLRELGEGGTSVRLVHDGWGTGGEWEEARSYFLEAWQVVLARLEDRVRNGPRDWSGPEPEGPASVRVVRGVEPVPVPEPPGLQPGR